MTSGLARLYPDAVEPYAGLRLARLHNYLTGALEDFDPELPMGVELKVGGRSNVTYVLSQAERSWIIRRPPLGNVMPSAHDMAREYRVLSGLTRAGFPVPRPLALCSDLEVLGAPFMLMEHVDGVVFGSADATAALRAPEAGQLSSSFVECLSRLHAVDSSTCGLSDLGRPEGFLPRQVARWTSQWSLTQTREVPEVDRLIDWLRRHTEILPTDLPSSVIHGDYRIDNVIVSPTSMGINSVIDWEMSTLGDPVFDLAIALVYWSEARDHLRHEVPVAERVTEGDGFWTRRQIVEVYQLAGGLSLDHLQECLVLACFKLAVIMESIHRRSLQGLQLGSVSENPGSMGVATVALARLGVAIAASARDDVLVALGR